VERDERKLQRLACVHAHCGQRSDMARLVNSLPAQTDAQRALSNQIAQAATHLSQLRLLLFAQSGGAIPTPFLVILVFWLATIITSFSLFGPMNATVLAFTCLFALSAAGAIFLIYELNNPFTGMLQISRTAMLDALGATAKGSYDYVKGNFPAHSGEGDHAVRRVVTTCREGSG
jgi:hypothetical protein